MASREAVTVLSHSLFSQLQTCFLSVTSCLRVRKDGSREKRRVVGTYTRYPGAWVGRSLSGRGNHFVFHECLQCRYNLVELRRVFACMDYYGKPHRVLLGSWLVVCGCSRVTARGSWLVARGILSQVGISRLGIPYLVVCYRHTRDERCG